MRYAAILGASVLAGLLAGPAMAQSARPALDYGKAASIRDGCLAFAKERKFEIAIAIFDDAGRLMTFARTDGAEGAVSDLAQWKAKSAAAYRISTETSAKWNAPNTPGLATMPGGLPIFSADGTPLGGVGVSGAAAPGGDAACAEAGLAAAGLRDAAK